MSPCACAGACCGQPDVSPGSAARAGEGTDPVPVSVPVREAAGAFAALTGCKRRCRYRRGAPPVRTAVTLLGGQAEWS